MKVHGESSMHSKAFGICSKASNRFSIMPFTKSNVITVITQPWKQTFFGHDEKAKQSTKSTRNMVSYLKFHIFRENGLERPRRSFEAAILMYVY